MIGIHTISGYLPKNTIDNIERGRSLGHSKEFIQQKIGALTLPVKEGSEETSDLAVRAVKRLCRKSGLSPENIEALVLVTQNGDGEGLPQTSAIVQKKLQLSDRIASFDISLGCSGYVYGLSILKGFMADAGLTHGVLVTADPYSKIIDPSDRITALLFGDAATATWIGADPKWTIARPLFTTDGNGADFLRVHNQTLEMNGRQIFNFVNRHVSTQIMDILNREGLRQEEIQIYCLHQASAAIIEAISSKFPTVKERFVSNLHDTGNTVSSSIPLLLEPYLERQAVQRIVLCGFGVGLSLATTIIEKRK